MSSRHQRIERMHRLRDQAAEWAARHHPQEIEAGIRCWIGEQKPDEINVKQGIAFALVALPEQGISLLERYRSTRRSWPRIERRLFEAWKSSWFAVCEVHGTRPGEGLILDDVLTGARHDVREESLSWMIEPGEWLVTVLMPVDDGLELEGTARKLPARGGLPAVKALLPYDDTDWAACSRRRMARVVEALHEASRPPRYVNHDGHDIEVLGYELALTWEELRAQVQGWEDMAEDEDCLTWTGRFVPELVGPLILASFHHEEDRVSLSVNSRERLAGLQQAWQERTGKKLALLHEQSHRPPSNPTGREVAMDSSYLRAKADKPPTEFEADMATNWLDQAIPALNGLSPREAVDVGRRAEVWSILPTALGREADEFVRRELGFPLLQHDDYEGYDADVPPDPDWWLSIPREERLDEIIEHHLEDAPHELSDHVQTHAGLHAVIENQVAEGWLPAVRTLQRFQDAGVWRHEAIHAQCGVLVQRLIEEEEKGIRWTETQHAEALAALDPADWLDDD